MSLPYISFSYQRPVNLHNRWTKPFQLHKSDPWYSKLIHWLVFVYTLCSYYKISVWSSNYILNVTSCDFWRDEKRSFYKYLFFFWLLRLRLPIADCLPQSHTTPAVTQTLHVFLHYILKPSLWSFTIHSPYIQSLYSHLQASSCPSLSLTVNMPSPSTLFLSSSNSTLVSSTQQGHEKYTGLWLPLLIGYILITSTSEMNFISTSNNLCPIWHEFCLDQGCW